GFHPGSFLGAVALDRKQPAQARGAEVFGDGARRLSKSSTVAAWLRATRRPPRVRSPSRPFQKNASVRISMLSRGRALGDEVGSSNAVWAVQRARPSLSESKTLNTSASSRRMRGK